MIPGDKLMRALHPDEPAALPIRSGGFDSRDFKGIELRGKDARGDDKQRNSLHQSGFRIEWAHGSILSHR
jgi:hypothetical protein